MSNRNSRTLLSVLVVGLLGAGLVWAQQKMDQGKPGTQGAWPVTLSSGTGGMATYPVRCTAASPHGYTAVGTTSTNVPASTAAGRVYTRVCLTLEASASAQLKCRTDGVAPAFGASAGEVLSPGDCATYTLVSTSNITCIANGASTPVSTFECITP